MAIINIARSGRKISCSGFFQLCLLQENEPTFKKIPAKIIAGFDEWQRWSNQYEESPSSITFSVIAPYISRPKQMDILWLKRFADDSPNSFAWQLNIQFFNEVEAVNPVRKARKKVVGSSAVLSIKERENATLKHITRQEIFRLSRWLYVFFRHWKEQSKSSWPEILENFCKRHDCRLESKIPLYVKVAQALSSVYGDENMFTTDGALSLYQNHIKGKIARIERALTSKHFLPVGTPLELFLKKYI